ncbi:MAG: N-acetyltransferase, partial [candidate division WOR-3 bacterium]
MSTVTVTPVETRQDLDQFVRLPFELYRDDPYWVPPLIADVRRTLTPGANPFWNRAERELFLARRGNSVVGRVAAIMDRNYNQAHASTVACFGFFETENVPETAQALLDQVVSWAGSRGATVVYGPANPSLNDEAGMLVEPFDSSPFVKMPYNPPFYPTLVERAGFTRAKDLYAYTISTDRPLPEKYERMIKMLKSRPEVKVRCLDLSNLKRDLEIIKEVYNDAWSDNWDFSPFTSEDIDDMARQLKPLVEPSLCPFVFCRDEPAGMSVALPDYNQVLKKLGGRLLPFGWLRFLFERRRINQGRLWALGLKKKFRHQGFDSLLYYETLVAARQLGYKQGEVSWILEDNMAIIRPILNLG